METGGKSKSRSNARSFEVRSSKARSFKARSFDASLSNARLSVAPVSIAANNSKSAGISGALLASLDEKSKTSSSGLATSSQSKSQFALSSDSSGSSGSAMDSALFSADNCCNAEVISSSSGYRGVVLAIGSSKDSSKGGKSKRNPSSVFNRVSSPRLISPISGISPNSVSSKGFAHPKRSLESIAVSSGACRVSSIFNNSSTLSAWAETASSSAKSKVISSRSADKSSSPNNHSPLLSSGEEGLDGSSKVTSSGFALGFQKGGLFPSNKSANVLKSSTPMTEPVEWVGSGFKDSRTGTGGKETSGGSGRSL